MTWKQDWLDPREPATGRRHNSSSYAGAAGKALLLRDGPTLKKIEKLVSLMSVFCGLTPELSRPARCGPVRSETAKRARLERIVRPLKPWLLAQHPERKIGLIHANPQPGGGITALVMPEPRARFFC